MSVEGATGIGKSAIVKTISNLLFERGYMSDGVLYLSLKDCNTIESLLKKMHISLKVFISDKNNFRDNTDDEFPDGEKLY